MTRRSTTDATPAPPARVTNPRRLSPALVLPLAILLGTLMRLAPCLRDPDFEFVVDAAYHERLTREVIDTGAVAALDRLSNVPEGRRTGDHLPLGIYFVGAGAQRLLAAAGSHDLRWNLALLIALSGGLIAVPVWLGVRALGGGPVAAGAAALLSVVLPAHLQRTFGFCLRYDGPGTLFAGLHAALVLAALRATRPRARWAMAAGSALALVAALASWRVGLLVLELEALASAAWLVWRGVAPGQRELWSAIAVIGTIGLIPVGYLGAHRFLVSTPWLAVLAVAIATWLPSLAPGRSRALRLGIVAGFAALTAFAGRPDTSGDYANLPAMLAARFGLTHRHDPLAALMLDVQELRGLSPWSLLVDPMRFVVMGVWLIATPAILWWLRTRSSAAPPRAQQSVAGTTLAVVTTGLVIATLAFERTGVLLAPFVAIALGVLAGRLMDLVPAPAPTRKGAPTRAAGRAPRLALLAALALSLAGTALVAAQQCGTAWARLDRDESEALAWLGAHAAPGDAVVCDWDAGYDVQTRAGLATFADGLLESARNRDHILELYGAFIDPSPARLRALCSRAHARWLLTPPGTAIPAMAHVTGGPLWEAIARGGAIGPGPMMEHTIVHLIGNDVDVPGFHRALTAGPFQVYEVLPESLTTPSGVPR